MHVWIKHFGREYWVMVDGAVYDTMYLHRGKKLSRDDMKSIADGYKEALENYVR